MNTTTEIPCLVEARTEKLAKPRAKPLVYFHGVTTSAPPSTTAWFTAATTRFPALTPQRRRTSS